MEEAKRKRREREHTLRELTAKRANWPDKHLVGIDGQPVPFHRAQEIAYDTMRRFVAMTAGTQSGKTGFGPWWLKHKIDQLGGGDYIAATASFDLFKLKMLPAMRTVFENIFGIARFWSGDRILELRDPATGEFKAKRADDPMWGRIILRSAESEGGLESATAKAGWLDEAGQDSFTIDTWRAILRRLAIFQGPLLITTTLYNLGWLKQQIMDKAVKGGKVMLEHFESGGEIEVTENERENICLVQFDSIINPVFPKDEFDHAKATMPDDEFQMFYRGRAAALRALIYDCFDRTKHTCPRFALPDSWPRYMGLDFGGVNTAALIYAEEPGTGNWYGYREYHKGGRTAKEHAEALLKGEPMVPFTVGGSKSEGQWRQEFRAGGLPVREPAVSEVNVGISRVYGAHKQNKIIYFDDLEGVLDQKGTYKRKRDKEGNITDEIENKATFHFMDAERYIIGYKFKEQAKRSAYAGLVE